MGLRDWLFPKKKTPGPRVVGRSRGGSRLLRYAGADLPGQRIGFTEESTAELAEARENAYGRIFGESNYVYHELLPLIPHVDVYQFPPTAARPFFTFVTGGMSDLSMNSPADVGPEYRRAELVFYASDTKREYEELLRRLAHFPHDNATWVHWGHTMPNGTPPGPIFGSPVLDTILFMPTIVAPDSSLGSQLSWAGEAIHLVWCVPISSAECRLKLERGTDALYALFDDRHHPFVYQGDRQSYV